MAYDVEGVEKSKIDTPSFYNVEECEAIVKIIKALQSDPNVDITTGQIAVITCFRAQVLKLREVLRKENLGTVNVGK
jgi:putative helicase MOV10L1/helicase MOV-10